MIQIGNKLVSLDIFEKKFKCHLKKCLGNCCVHGDEGAPLTEDETRILEAEYENIKNYITPGGIQAIEKSGKWVIDNDMERVTPLIGRDECVYTTFDDGIARCAIEIAWANGKTSFRKPVSCHLYPIRISRIGSYVALNFHQWSVCKPAIILGEQLNLPVYKFLKEPIIREFGAGFYAELEEVAANIKVK